MEYKFTVDVSAKEHTELIAKLAEESYHHINGEKDSASKVAVVDGRIVIVEVYRSEAIVHIAALIAPAYAE